MKIKLAFYSILFIFIAFSCKSEPALTAQNVVDKSIEVSGGKHLFSKMIDFNFRDIHYKAIRHTNGDFQFQRLFKDSLSVIKDVLSNNGFQRYANGFPIAVPDTMATKYSASVNSVHYFVQLPYGLNEAAVNKQLLGLEIINEKEYYKIKVTFNEDGGGEDFEDVFIYWINAETFKIDYLAYSYNEDDGLGLRFREAYNERIIQNIRFVDYNNYKPKDATIALEDIGTLFEKNGLQLLSKIETENVVVNTLVDNN